MLVSFLIDMKFRLGIEFILVFLSLSLNNVSSDSQTNKQRISNHNSKIPFVAILYKPKDENVRTPESESDVITPEISPVEPPHDQELYNFYHILRTTQENEEVDEDAAMIFEKTENVLRQALRARCEILDMCVRKCPWKKRYTCTITCREEYDDYDICKKPQRPYCRRPKCGRTMPPSWLLRKLK
ncbi:uncharacterized protein LOC124540827 [Vanessa cardui]|uniref:uncharacterized protein LOC124540827 n=1 Tax=Vanessa cardui TaxID=171605 RepID=UPI001F13ADAF|nr:uncharacterized protein LOC124540827 [Vanessa cardui]